MWEIRKKKGKYVQRWKPSKVEVFELLVIASAIIYLIYQFIRG